MDYLRFMAGFFVGSAGLMLIWQGQAEKGMILLVGMLSFFVGEKNGQKKVSSQA